MKHTLAFPSWVIPGGIAENAAFLHQKCCALPWPPKLHKKIEIGLCFFETAACLAYTKADLPPALSQLPISWHVHLPLDLPLYAKGATAQDARQSLAICLELMRKTDFLKTKKAVLHPVCHLKSPGKSLTAYFIELWTKAGLKASDLLLENQPGQNLPLLQSLAAQTGCGLCLDLAHLFMGLKQEPSQGKEEKKEQKQNSQQHPDWAPTLQQLVASGYLKQVQMLHLNALHCPNNVEQKQNGHAALTVLSGLLQQSYAQLLQNLPAPCVLMLELFSWQKIEQSLPLLKQWLTSEENAM